MSKSERSRARSGRLHGRVRHAGLSFRVATRRTVSLLHGITRHNGRLVGTTPCTRSRLAQRAFGRNRTLHTITIGTTSHQHHERPYHACTTGGQHNGRSYHASTTGECTTEPA